MEGHYIVHREEHTHGGRYKRKGGGYTHQGEIHTEGIYAQRKLRVDGMYTSKGHTYRGGRTHKGNILLTNMQKVLTS